MGNYFNELPKNDQVQTAKKVTKINARITTNAHAQLQTLTKTPAKFKKAAKIVGGVVFTKYPASICFDS